jgi:hypothetical protein
MDSYHYSKKDYYDSLDTISATFIGLVNVAISAVLKIGILELYCFFIMSFLEYPKRWAYVLASLP